jgi:hypothetical protein
MRQITLNAASSPKARAHTHTTVLRIVATECNPDPFSNSLVEGGGGRKQFRYQLL